MVTFSAAVGNNRFPFPPTSFKDDFGCVSFRESHVWSAGFLESAVAAFVAGYVLMLNDRHQSNMMISAVDGESRFAHIDFGWIGLERPSLDTGEFPIPAGAPANVNSRWRPGSFSIGAGGCACVEVWHPRGG